jgi:Phosphotransferase enzyme family
VTVSSSDQPPPGADSILGGGRSGDPDLGSAAVGADARARFLRDDLVMLWPAPGQFELTGRRLVRPRDGLSYAVLPNSRHPALLLPTSPRVVAAEMLRNYKTSATSLSRVKFRAMALVARAGALRLHSSQVLVHDATGGPDADLVGHLRQVFGHDVHVAVYMGSPRANRKPVLQILGPDARTLAFAKVGTTALTRSLVRHEGSTLCFLATRPMERVVTPRVLHHGLWHGHEILVQEALGQERVPTGDVRSALKQAMVEVAGLDGIVTRNLKDSSYLRRLNDKISHLQPDTQAARLQSAIDALQPIATSAEIPFGAWHGDWTPWNMLFKGDRIQVWDWERFETDVPVGFDALHFALQRSVAQDHNQAGSAATTLLDMSGDLLAPFGISVDSARLVATLYLLDLGARYLKDGQHAAGAALGDLRTWLLPAVADSSQRLRIIGS